MIPEDKHWLTGFRVVLAEMPATEPLPAINDICVKNISQQNIIGRNLVMRHF